MIDWFVLEAYFENRCTAAERVAVEQWIAASSENAHLADRVREALQSRAQHDWGTWDRATAIDAVLTRVRETRPAAVPYRNTRGFDRRSVSQALRMMMGIATAVLAVWLVGGVRRRAVTNAAPTVHTTTTGQRALITLPDGSQVILGPQSSLAVAPDFEADARRVVLRGEAYFTVDAAANAPFIVTTDNITTRVLGTAFNLRHYPGDHAVQVFVHTGKVVTAGRTSTATVTAGLGAYVTDSTVRETTIHELGQYTDLANQRLVFTRTPVPELLTALGRWYGYDFRLADSSLVDERVSAMIKASDAGEMLKMLRTVLDVSMTFDGQVVKLVPNRHGAHERRSLIDAPVRAMVRATARTPITDIGR